MKIFRLFACFGKPPNKEYSGVADFMLNASPEEKIKVFKKAAEKANEDQRQVIKQAQLKR